MQRFSLELLTFFFSSRRRHTRLVSDWSSDVCSSDLAGQGIATPGDILARIFARRGLSLSAYNAYQSIIRGGHTFLIIRASDAPVGNMGDNIDVLVPLNQDTMDRHLKLLKNGACVIYDGDK